MSFTENCLKKIQRYNNYFLGIFFVIFNMIWKIVRHIINCRKKYFNPYAYSLEFD